jgi:hypothetical protein
MSLVRRGACRAFALTAASLFVAACDSRPPGNPSPISPDIAFRFAEGPQGWVHGFSDYSLTSENAMQLVGDYRPLRAPLASTQSAFFLSADNRSDDVFMFIKKRVAGLAAGKDYSVRFTVEIATDTPYGCSGAGGSPGESVYVKAGATAQEPAAVLTNGFYAFSVDKGNQANGGSAALVLGNVANSTPCQAGPDGPLRTWELKTLVSESRLKVRTAPDGTLWVFAGADSGFEGNNRLYFTTFTAALELVN